MKLDPKDPILLTQALVQCASVTPDCAEVLDLVEGILSDLNFSCQRLPFGDDHSKNSKDQRVDNLYARLGTGTPVLMFAGHVDVVPTGPFDQWQDDPFSGAIRGGKLYGRGSADMKGGVASFISACAELSEKMHAFDGSIALLITGDEEGPAIHGTREMLIHLAESGETWGACITGEPTSLKKIGDAFKPGRRGSVNLELRISGVQGHTGYPHLAENAAHYMIDCLNNLKAWVLDDGSDNFEPSNLSITTIDIGNAATNIIPGQATAKVNIRFNDHHSGQSLIDQVKARISKTLPAQIDWSLESHISAESFVTNEQEFRNLVIQSCEDITGITPQAITSGGTSDSRFIKDYCPVIDLGLVGQTMHKINEHIEIADLLKLKQIYAKIIESYFKL